MKLKKHKSPVKGIKQNHSANTKFGMGDYYGVGIRNKVGTSKDVMGLDGVSKKKLKKPPRSLA